MKVCRQCGVYIKDQNTCVVCGKILTPSNKKVNIVLQNYPEDKIKKNQEIVIRVFASLTILIYLIVVMLNLLFWQDNPFLWSLIVIGSITYIWLMYLQLIHTNGSYSKRIVRHVIGISLILVTIDILTRYRGWAITYVVPLLLLATTILLVFVISVNPKRYHSHVLNLLMLLMINVIPLILYFTTNIFIKNIIWPSLSIAVTSLSVLIGMFIIAPKTTKEEIHKKFHL